MKRVYRAQYLRTCRQLDALYAEAQSRGELSRTKLWNYRRWREMEPKLREFCEAQNVIQVDQIRKTLDKVFEQTIGASVEAFKRDDIVLPYDPRAVIDTAWSGEHYSSRVWRNTGELAERIQQEAQQIVMGDKSPSTVKKQLMKDFDVAYGQAERLVDTEVSYVLNRANLAQYERMGTQKVEITTLDVNTCEKCAALEGEVFAIEDAPVLPIHPRCHCAYCVPEEGDEAEITASGANLDEVYARHGVKGYESAKPYTPKARRAAEVARENGLISASELQVKLERAMAETKAQTSAEVAEAAKKPGNTAISVLQGGAESGITPIAKEADENTVRYIGKINKEVFSVITDEFVTDEIVITEKQIQHANEHNGAYDKYAKYLTDVITAPDYIFEDNRPNTGIAVKRIPQTDGRSLQVVVRIKTADDPEEFENSVISFWDISERRLKRYLKNRILLYEAKNL